MLILVDNAVIDAEARSGAAECQVCGHRQRRTHRLTIAEPKPLGERPNPHELGRHSR
jgi:hypothetical protein